MSALVQSRHNALRHHLPDDVASQPPTAAWLTDRAQLFARTAGVRVRVILDPVVYQAITGVAVDPWRVGDAFTGPAGARLSPAIVLLNPALLPSRGDADLTIAHEIMHVRWPSYGHKPIAFSRAQQLLDAVDGGAASRWRDQ